MVQSKWKFTLLMGFTFLGIMVLCFNTFIPRNSVFLLYDAKRVFICSVLLISNLIILSDRHWRVRITQQFTELSPSVWWVLVIFGIFAAIANFQGIDFWRAQTDYFYFLGLALLTAFLSIGFESQKVRLYSYFCWISLLLFLSVSVGFWLRVYYQLETNIHTIFGFANARFLNQVQVWLIIPTLYFTLCFRRKRWLYNALRFLLCTHVAIIFALDARGISIAIITAILIWAKIDKPLRSQILKLLLFSIIFGCLLRIVFLAPLPAYLFNDGLWTWPKVRTDSPGRMALWAEAITLSSLLGLGGDGFVCSSKLFGRPHNSALLVLVNWGLIPLLCYGFLLLITLKTVITTYHRWVRVTGLSVLAGFAYSLVSGVLDSPLSQLLAVISLAIFWSACKKHHPVCASHPSKIKHQYFQYGIVGVLLLSSLLTANKLYLRITNYPDQEFSVQLKPQFWLGYNCSEPILFK